MLGRLFNKISGAGLMLALIGTLLLAFSLRDTVISFKTAKSFDQQIPLHLAVGKESVQSLIGGFKGLDDCLQILRGILAGAGDALSPDNGHDLVPLGRPSA